MNNFPTPTQLDAIQTSKDQGMFDQCMASIQKELQEKYVQGGIVNGSIACTMINPRIVNRIKVAMSEKDWLITLKYESDQRDGDYYFYAIKAKS